MAKKTSKPKPKRVSAVGLVRAGSRFLFGYHKKRGGWELVGGEAREDETLVEALHREVKEEAGVDINNVEFAGIVESTADPRYLCVCFRADMSLGHIPAELLAEPDTHSAMRLFDKPPAGMTPDVVQVLEKAFGWRLQPTR